MVLFWFPKSGDFKLFDASKYIIILYFYDGME